MRWWRFGRWARTLPDVPTVEIPPDVGISSLV